MAGKTEVETINVPGQVTRVDASQYAAMKAAMLEVMSAHPISAAEIEETVKPDLPEGLFPSGSTSGWWVTSMQPDLGAKGVLMRHATKPLRWSKT